MTDLELQRVLEKESIHNSIECNKSRLSFWKDQYAKGSSYLAYQEIKYRESKIAELQKELTLFPKKFDNYGYSI